MPKVFRVMKEQNGKPVVGGGALMLGVRVPTDVTLDEAGMVNSDGGMSVSPSLSTLPFCLVPRRLRGLRRGATGNDRHRVWRAGEGSFANGLFARDLRLANATTTHGTIGGVRPLSLNQLQRALAATIELWVIDEA